MTVDISEKYTASIFKVFRRIYPEDCGRMIYLPDQTASKLKKATRRILTILQALTSHRHTFTSYCHRLFFLLVVNFTPPSGSFLGNASRRYDNCFILKEGVPRLSMYRLYRHWPGATENNQVRVGNNPVLF